MDIGIVHGGRHDKPPTADGELTARAKLAELADSAHQANHTEEVRHDRVILAQERVENAFYSRNEIRQAMVDRLADDIKPSDSEATDRLEEIKHRIRRGEYLKNDVVEQLADRLTDSFWGDDPDIEDETSHDGYSDT